MPPRKEFAVTIKTFESLRNASCDNEEAHCSLGLLKHDNHRQYFPADILCARLRTHLLGARRRGRDAFGNQLACVHVWHGDAGQKERLLGIDRAAHCLQPEGAC